MKQNMIEEAIRRDNLECIVDFQMLAEAVALQEEARWYGNEESRVRSSDSVQAGWR